MSYKENRTCDDDMPLKGSWRCRTALSRGHLFSGIKFVMGGLRAVYT